MSTKKHRKPFKYLTVAISAVNPDPNPSFASIANILSTCLIFILQKEVTGSIADFDIFKLYFERIKEQVWKMFGNGLYDELDFAARWATSRIFNRSPPLDMHGYYDIEKMLLDTSLMPEIYYALGDCSHYSDWSEPLYLNTLFDD